MYNILISIGNNIFIAIRTHFNIAVYYDHGNGDLECFDAEEQALIVSYSLQW